MQLARRELCTRRAEFALEVKFYLDVHWVYMAIAKNADQLKWRQIRISAVSAWSSIWSLGISSIQRVVSRGGWVLCVSQVWSRRLWWTPVRAGWPWEPARGTSSAGICASSCPSTPSPTQEVSYPAHTTILFDFRPRENWGDSKNLCEG